jgi:hypothetical protein
MVSTTTPRLALGDTEMKTKTVVAVILGLCLCARVGMAQTNEEAKQALGELAGEFQQCSVYFLVVSTCVAQQDPALSATYRKLSDKVSNLSISTGRTVGVSDEAYTAMGMLEAKTMKKSIGNDCVNIAVLLKQYMNFCQQLSHDADPRLKEWIVCIHASNRTCNSPWLKE